MTIKVMIVDDSLVVRGLLRTMITRDRDIEVVASSPDGVAAVSDYDQFHPDVVLMDVEMPHMDGLAAVEKILANNPAAKIIMCSSLTKHGATTTVKALNLGAVDFLTKPSAQTVDRSSCFEQELVTKIKAVARPTSASRPLSGNFAPAQTDDVLTTQSFPDALPRDFPQAIAIGASTGGLQAIINVLKDVAKPLLLPIFITQHMPNGFAASFAENIERRTGIRTAEAEDNMLIAPGHAYIAPGNMHMGIKPGFPRRIQLMDSAPVNYCKPSINVMLDSVLNAYQDGIITIMLTGMGEDGKTACHNLAKSRHNILIAQDKESSVVWSIPGAVAKAGLCHAIQSPAGIGRTICRLLKRETITSV